MNRETQKTSLLSFSSHRRAETVAAKQKAGFLSASLSRRRRRDSPSVFDFSPIGDPPQAHN